MGQDDILKVLRKSKKWLSANEIAIKVKRNRSSTRRCLKKLKEQNSVKVSKEDTPWGAFTYSI